MAGVVSLDGIDAAVLAIPDEFAVGVDGAGVLFVAVFVEDVRRSAWLVAVCVVVLDDQAAIGGLTEDFARAVTAVAGIGLFGLRVWGVGDVGFGGFCAAMLSGSMPALIQMRGCRLYLLSGWAAGSCKRRATLPSPVWLWLVGVAALGAGWLSGVALGALSPSAGALSSLSACSSFCSSALRARAASKVWRRAVCSAAGVLLRVFQLDVVTMSLVRSPRQAASGWPFSS